MLYLEHLFNYDINKCPPKYNQYPRKKTKNAS